MLTGCFGYGSGRTVRELKELGVISLPKRLETRNATEAAGFALFRFERPSGSWLQMGGPNTPMVEILAVGAWTESSRGEAHDGAQQALQYHMKSQGVAWRKEGSYEIGEGTQEVSSRGFPAWLVVRDAAEKRITVAYMVWKKESSLEKARAMVDEAVASFEGRTSMEQYLATAAERPVKDRVSRMARLETGLAARGVRVEVDGGPVEKDGVLYEIHSNGQVGRVFSMFYRLGGVAPADDYRWMGTPPREFANWMDVVWMAQRDGGWVRQGTSEADGWMTARMRERITGLPRDGKAATAYAIQAWLIDDLEMPEADVEYTLRLGAKMAELHGKGRLLIRLAEMR